MELKEALYQRRSVRQYTQEVVSRETIEELLDAAVQAPSATNSQPWAFAVLRGAEALEKHSTAARAFLLPHISDDHPLSKYKAALANPKFNIFYGTGTLVLIFAKPNNIHGFGDCCLAAQNLMLAAHEKGLGSCWIGFASYYLNQPEQKAAFGIPADYELVAPIILGYPALPSAAIAKKPAEIIAWKELD
ncbi:nitroreductase [Azotosporobacter soli]|uniref:nitroreductase family protein n=1 Tax=Azotosporobacter soli TaxID=3055040 RepID=UPI0031FF2039